MKKLLYPILRFYLKIAAKTALAIHRPVVIAVAGSANKSFVKSKILSMLRESGMEARANAKNFNTAIGLPLAILGLPSGYNSYKKWLPVLLEAPKAVFSPFPGYLVLELGTSDPGDMKYLLSIVKPDVAVITSITQRYLESFSDMNQLVGEYRDLAGSVPGKGLLVLNADNERVVSAGQDCRCRKVLVGFSENADIRAQSAEKLEDGQRIMVKSNGQTLDHKIKRFGRHHVYALLMGLAVKKHVGIHEKTE